MIVISQQFLVSPPAWRRLVSDSQTVGVWGVPTGRAGLRYRPQRLQWTRVPRGQPGGCDVWLVGLGGPALVSLSFPR